MTESSTTSPRALRPWIYSVLMIYVLLAGAYLRFVGLDWDEDQHLHPDERFLTMVESAIEPVSSLGEYFDTENSSLNPHNRGHGFFVYGTLPIFIVRYVADWLGKTGYGEVYLVGRILSATMDLLVVWLVYLVAARLYERRVGVLAAAFSAFSVLQIQQSHFFTVDTFINFFTFLAVWFAVQVVTTQPESNRESVSPVAQPETDPQEGGAHSLDYTARITSAIQSYTSHPIFLPNLLFGVALGMAVASKINAVPVALVLPAAALLYYLRLSPRERDRQAVRIFSYLVLAALVSLITFRIFQPYAFSGPGFFGLTPNEKWIENLKSLRAQTTGDVDFPPALQWARRPVWFSLQNMVLWGLGLPLGLLAWSGFLWMGWRMIKGEWKKHALLWGWTAFYFGWQSLVWNSTMRYQLPVYPTLVIFAAWLVVTCWDSASKRFRSGSEIPPETSTRGFVSRLPGILVLLVAGFALLATFAWAFAFTRIYTRPHTRVEATRWMIQNLPGPITLQIQEADGEYNQPLPFPRDTTLRAGTPYNTSFTAHADGILEEVYLPHVVDQRTVPDLGSLLLTISAAAEENTGLAKAILPAGQIPKEPPGEDVIFLSLDQPLEIVKGKSYSLGLQVVDGLDEVKLCGPVNLEIQTPDVLLTQTIPPPLECVLQTEAPYAVTFTANFTGTLSQATISQLSMVEIYEPFNQELTLSITQQLDGEPLATGSVASDFTPGDDRRGDPYRILLDRPVVLTKGEVYHLGLSIEGGQGEIKLSGTALANETTWDDGLPLRMDGYDPYGGIYQGDLNFEMYWDDNQEKLDRFISTLDQADYVLITSSRQWGSTTRVPERYPLTSHYYRNLVGCPAERSIEWCYNVARPGEFQGELGFDLVKVFQSDPSIGSWRINDQFAEEAFTVYDHPKVLVFQKSENYDPLKVRELLGQVDLSQVIHVTPRQADSNPGNLMLPLERLTEQRTGGTWSDLFNSDAPHNRYKILGVLVWYLSVSVLGLLTYPLLRYVLPGLSDRGYPLARIAGMLILAWFVWLAGSARIPFTRLTIGAVLMLMTLLGGVLAYRQRDELRREWQEQRKYFLIVEGLTLAFFLVGLLIRFGNPDLWHPWKGGEKPMDFSYFNAVLKSTSFPPYDPWFAGGYINYYYYGFVIVGVLVKFLGIVPAFAYNLIMPTLLSMIAMGAFSAVWNLTRESTIGNTWSAIFRSPRLWLSVGGSMGMAVLGNLGVVRMFYRGFQTIAAPGVELETVGFWKKLIWFIEGVFKALTGSPLPYRVDEWYWNPSRVIDAAHGNPITEFPFFTFLYGDMHAHLFALPIALLVIGWVLSVVLGRAWARERARSPFQVVLSLVVGGIAIGALYPVNLSDIYTYLPLGVVAAAYAIFRYAGQQDYTIPLLSRLPKKFTVLLFSLGSVVALVGFSRLFYQPYAHWYGQGYDEVEIWAGTHTPLSDYLVMWGLFLFIIVSWLVYESIDWMAKTPVSALRRLEPYREAIFLIIIFILMITLGLGIDLNLESPIDGKLPLGLGIHVAWLVLPLGTWAGVLLLRPDMPDPKRVVLFFIGTGLVITLVVEVVTVTGDIGRMNTVFKYYLQAWTLFAVSAAAALGWMLKSISRWSLNLRTAWQMLLIALVVSTALYPLFASLAKIDDRMAEDAPMTLDGMAYMKYATYHDFDTALDLNQDYEAIRWLQENVEGSPVIVEAHVVEYHWGTRYTIYTGLPGVVGWNWHQRQQRTTVSHEWVFDRVDAVHNFYQTTDLNVAVDFLKEYDVRYVILGQLERAEYPGPGLDKFAAQEGNLWRQVYNQQDTVIYEVLP